jgi:hypothetical protein
VKAPDDAVVRLAREARCGKPNEPREHGRTLSDELLADAGGNAEAGVSKRQRKSPVSGAF